MVILDERLPGLAADHRGGQPPHHNRYCMGEGAGIRSSPSALPTPIYYCPATYPSSVRLGLSRRIGISRSMVRNVS